MADHDRPAPSIIRRSILRAEARVDAFGEWWRDRTGRRRKGTLSAHAGYVHGDRARVLARVLEPQTAWTPSEGDGRLANLRGVGSLFRTAEIPHARLRLAGAEETIVRADGEGYVDAEVRVRPRATTSWDAVRGSYLPEAGADAGDTEAVDLPILHVGSNARFAVVSDIDDTVMQTGAENLIRNLWTTFTGNVLTRRVYEHVPALYRALAHAGGEGVERTNPIFYLSSSPWNLYGMIREVLKRNDVPWGPIFLRDFGIDETKFIKGTHGGHKRGAALTLMQHFDGLPFLLIGDLGQADAEIYAAVARERRDQMLGVILHQPSDRRHEDKRVHVRELEELGVPTLVTTDYADALAFARDHKWIDREADAVSKRGIA